MSFQVCVAFAGASVEVRAHGSDAEHLVTFALRNLPQSKVQDALGAGSVRLEMTVQGDQFLLRRGEFVLARDVRAGAVIDSLLGNITYHLADRGRIPLLHASLLVCRGRTILCPGASGAGKSTLTAWLASHGGSVATDELVGLEGTSAHGLTRPIHLKRGSRAVADALLREVGDDHHVRWEGGDFVHPEALGASVVRGSVVPDVIVFPHWQGLHPTELRAMRAAEAARKIMETMIDARNLEGHGVPTACTLARKVPAFELVYADLSEATQLLERQFHACLKEPEVRAATRS